MNFLITGAAGFLGSSLANNLAREGHQVRGLDDLSTGDPQVLSPDIHFTRGDVSDRPKLWTLLQEVDVVYHLAARVSVSESVLYPRDYNTVNVGGTVALMEAMRDVGVRRVVLASSGAVYGDLGEQPLRDPSYRIRAHLMRFQSSPRNIMCARLDGCGASKRSACKSSTLMGRGNIFRLRIRRWYHTFCGRLRAAERLWFTAMAIKRAIMFMWTTWSARWWPPPLRQMWMGWSSMSARESRQALVTWLKIVLGVTDGKPEVIYNSKTSGGVSRMAADLDSCPRKTFLSPFDQT